MAWREAAWRSARPPAGVLVPLPTPRPSAGRPLADTILARGSTREFSGAAIDAEELSTALWHATRGGQADVPVVRGSGAVRRRRCPDRTA